MIKNKFGFGIWITSVDPVVLYSAVKKVQAVELALFYAKRYRKVLVYNSMPTKTH